LNRSDEKFMQRRVAGYHDIRLDGLTDLVLRAKGQKVLDLGCNRGLVGFEMFNNGATTVHGCDIDEGCIWTARGLFADRGSGNLGPDQAGLSVRGNKALQEE